MLEVIDQLIQTAMTAITQGSPLAVITLFLVVAFTECGVPFPFILDSVLFFSSYQAGSDPLHIIFVMLIVFLGRQFGAAAIYWITRVVGNAAIFWFGKRFKQLKYNWAQMATKFSTQAPMPIAFVRITGLMTLVSVIAGAMRIRYSSFAIGVALSSVIFDGALIILGVIAKYGFQFIGFTPSVWHVAVGLIVIMALVMLIVRLRSRRRSSINGSNNNEIKKSVTDDN